VENKFQLVFIDLEKSIIFIGTTYKASINQYRPKKISLQKKKNLNMKQFFGKIQFLGHFYRFWIDNHR